MDWYDKAMEELETELANGEMTDREFREAVRDLNEQAVEDSKSADQPLPY